MSYNFFTCFLVVCGVVCCSAEQCRIETIQGCMQHLSAIASLGDEIDEKGFIRNAMKICDILDKSIDCLRSCELPESVADTFKQPIQQHKDLCDLNTFMKHSQVYKDNVGCINKTLPDAFICVRDTFAAHAAEPPSLEKTCCSTQTKMLCFKEKLPETCNGKTMEYDFIEEMRNLLHTECSKTLCSAANSLLFTAILPVLIASVVFGRLL